MTVRLERIGHALPCRQKDATRRTDCSSKWLYDRTIRTVEKAERENGIIEVGAKEEERIFFISPFFLIYHQSYYRL